MKINRIRTVWVPAVLAALAVTAGGAKGADIDLAIHSHYVWRGQMLNDEPVFQPSVTVAQGGFGFNWWGNLNLTDKVTGDEFEFSEHDVGVSYTRPCPLTGAEVKVGLVSYDFPNSVAGTNAVGAEALTKNTHEVYLSYSLAELLLAPTLLVSYDFNEVKDVYVNLAVSQSFALAEKLSINLGTSVGFAGADYNEFYFGVDDAAVNDANASVGLTYAFSETLSLGGTVNYTALLDSDIEEGAEAIYGEKDAVYGGVTLSMTF